MRELEEVSVVNKTEQSPMKRKKSLLESTWQTIDSEASVQQGRLPV